MVNPPSEKKNKKKKTGKARKASFRRRNRPHEVAPASPAESASGDADPVRDGEEGWYGDYSLMDIPRQAWPARDRRNFGIHSYTVHRGQGKIEVLLNKKAFFVRGENSGQITWAKHGGVKNAWIVACTRAGVLP